MDNPFTTRELKIIKYLIKDKSQRFIGARLGLSQSKISRTIRGIRQRMIKLNDNEKRKVIIRILQKPPKIKQRKST